MPGMPKSILQIKTEILPPLLRGARTVEFYGDPALAYPELAASMHAYTEALATAPVTRLARLVDGIVQALQVANPANIAAVQARTGVDPVEVLDAKVEYQKGVSDFDVRSEEIPALLESVRSLMHLWAPINEDRKAHLEQLMIFIQAGTEFLAENEEISASVGWIRLNDRVTELISRAEAVREGARRMDLAKAACEEMLAGFASTSSRLVAKWCEKRGIPIAGYEVPADVQAEAAAVHADLLERYIALSDLAKTASACERAAALSRVGEVSANYALQTTDIFRLRNGAWEVAKEHRSAKYLNPLTGQVWSGKGAVPDWLAGQDLSMYEA